MRRLLLLSCLLGLALLAQSQEKDLKVKHKDQPIEATTEAVEPKLEVPDPGALKEIPEQQVNGHWVLVIHGGAGGSAPGSMPEDEQNEYRSKLNEALETGAKMLREGKPALDAVETVIVFMEDCPLFNAGKGSVLTIDGAVEMDAAIMDGKTGLAGAVASVTNIKNPVKAARLVMEQSKHLLLVGDGAENFAKNQGLEIVGQEYFITPEMKKRWEDKKKGTVGAVALDVNGNLAAATSTGGIMNKMHGRVGDTPIIGAGTYANNANCAVSCTGQGEFFIRNVIAFNLSALMEYRNMNLEEAANYLVMEKLKEQGGEGGLIAVDKNGNIAMPFNTNAMFRGFIRSDGASETAIY